MKTMYYKLLSKLFPDHWKVGWSADMMYGVDYGCDIVYVANLKNGKKKVLKVKAWRDARKHVYK